jgi:HSP20 family protein
MELVRMQPFEGLGNINDRFEDAYGRSRRLHAAPAGVWYPPVDILENKDAYLIRAELPGMKKEDFHLELADGTLTLSGERKFEEPTNGDEYHRVERLAGKFSRSFHIPQAVKHDGIKATYRDGILRPRKQNQGRSLSA